MTLTLAPRDTDHQIDQDAHTHKESTMSKELKYLGTGAPSDPLNLVAGDISAVKALNGHKADDAEIAAELRAAGLEPSTENIARIRDIVG